MNKDGEKFSFCGSSDCMKQIKEMGQEIGTSISKQQEAGILSLKELMISYHSALNSQIQEFKQSVEEDRKDYWPRLREMETKVALIQSDIGKEGLEDKIKKVSRDASDAHSARSLKRSIIEVAGIVIATVLSALIIAHWIEAPRTDSQNNNPEVHPKTTETSKAVKGE